MTIYNLISLLGIFGIAFFAWVCSESRKTVNWRVVFWGIGLQMFFAFFIFVVPVGSKVFLAVNGIVIRVLATASAGTQFLFGRLAVPMGQTTEAGEPSLGNFLAFQGLPTIIFFAALVGALYYLKIMPLVIRGFAFVFTKLMRISGAESLCASSNIFVGAESALVIQPHLAELTRSELTTILAAMMGTIASTVLAVYVMFLQNDLPTIAGHLISASFLSAPAAVVMAKLLVPERDVPTTLGVDIQPHYEREDNLIMAIINGAWSGLRLLGGIIVLLIAFLGLLALLDLFLGWVGGACNTWFGWHFDWSFRSILGYVAYPFTLLLGVPPGDALPVAQLIGERTVATEVAAYQHLAQYLEQGTITHARSAIIASYALCGFAHIASLAIFVGGVGALVPERYKDLSRVAFKALLAATLACLMTGAVAGLFTSESSILLGR
ncbi:MAG: NupC/NupG family nucleoside CNT transporter [Candidatus Aminicenantales bacterium]